MARALFLLTIKRAEDNQKSNQEPPEVHGPPAENHCSNRSQDIDTGEIQSTNPTWPGIHLSVICDLCPAFESLSMSME